MVHAEDMNHPANSQGALKHNGTTLAGYKSLRGFQGETGLKGMVAPSLMGGKAAPSGVAPAPKVGHEVEPEDYGYAN